MLNVIIGSEMDDFVWFVFFDLNLRFEFDNDVCFLCV